MQLMTLALNKYTACVEKKEWKAPLAKQQKILALEAKLHKLKSGKKPQPQQQSKNDKNSGGKKDGEISKSPKREGKPA